jgi:hypothetical protein
MKLFKELSMKLVDRTGQRFGRLLAVEQAGRNALHKVLWKCVCDCGQEVVTTSGSLVTGNTTSCGCYLMERITKHGAHKKSSYHTWRAMMRRCYREGDKDYPRYGGAGVSVCPEWHDYEVFAVSMGEPTGDQTLDRINTYGNYSPENCRWASVKTQNRNQRVRTSNKAGCAGVRQKGERWFAQIKASGKTYYSKGFANVAEAIAERHAMELRYWGAG